MNVWLVGPLGTLAGYGEMLRKNIGGAKELWLAKAALNSKGFLITTLEDSFVVTEKGTSWKRVFDSEYRFYMFANSHGAAIDLSGYQERARQDRGSHATEDTKAYDSRSKQEPPGDKNYDGQVSDQLRKLQAELTRVRDLGKRAVAQRDEWERRATLAEARLKELMDNPATSQTNGVDRRFDELKRLLAREFHPDQSKTDGIEKIVRAEIFKILWPKVEDISRAGR